MKFFSTSKVIDYKLIELPKTCYKVMPPRKVEVVLTVAVIILTAITWSLF